MNTHLPTTLYPEIEPYRHGTLSLDSLHTMYWEESGNPKAFLSFFYMAAPVQDQPHHIAVFSIRHIIALSFTIKEARAVLHRLAKFATIPHRI